MYNGLCTQLNQIHDAHLPAFYLFDVKTFVTKKMSDNRTFGNIREKIKFLCFQASLHFQYSPFYPGMTLILKASQITQPSHLLTDSNRQI